MLGGCQNDREKSYVGVHAGFYTCMYLKKTCFLGGRFIGGLVFPDLVNEFFFEFGLSLNTVERLPSLILCVLMRERWCCFLVSFLLFTCQVVQ